MHRKNPSIIVGRPYKPPYPYVPTSIDVYWDNGCWVAIATDDDGTRYNVARPNCQTRRDAILDGREYLGLDNAKYEAV